MDLNGLIRKIEKYTDVDLKFSMREFKQLQLLREDILRLEEIMNHPSRNQKELLKHYLDHAKSLERHSERIERRLNIWIKRLEKLISEEEEELSDTDKSFFESWINKVNICNNNLIRIIARGGELQILLKQYSTKIRRVQRTLPRQTPGLELIKVKIEEAMGNNRSPGLRTLVALFKQLESLEERLGKGSGYDISQGEYQKRLQQLAELEFPIRKERQLADFLINHWEGTTKLAKLEFTIEWHLRQLFREGLPAVGPIISRYPWTWPGMLEIAEATTEHAPDVFKGLPAIMDIINKKTWPGIVGMAKTITFYGTTEVYKHGLPAIKDIINEKTWPGIVEMAEAAGKSSSQLFQYALPAVKDKIPQIGWNNMVAGFVKIGKKGGKHKGHIIQHSDRGAHVIFEFAIPAVSHIINRNTWSRMVDDLIKMEYLAGSHPDQLFDFGFKDIKSLINEKYWPGIVEMCLASEDRSGGLFGYSFKDVLDIINDRTWPGMVKLVKAARGGSVDVFFGLREFKELVNERTLPGIIEIVEAIRDPPNYGSMKYFFREVLPPVMGKINERTFPAVVELIKETGFKSTMIFTHGFPLIIDKINERNMKVFIDGFVKILKASDEGASPLLEKALPAVKDIINEQTWPLIVDYFLEILTYCKGTEERVFSNFSGLKPLFDLMGIELFDELIIPTVKSQTIGAFLCFQSLSEIAEMGGINNKEDIKILRFIVEKQSRRANDVLKNIIIQGLERKAITGLSQEAEIIAAFLKQTPAYLIELYIEFKIIYQGNLADKHVHYGNLFKDVIQLKKDIVEGKLTKEYDENIILGVLYSVFTPEISVDRAIYKRIIDSRSDRQSDIPAALNRISGKEVNISKGSNVLKEELDVSSWNNLVEAVIEVNRDQIKVDPIKLGMNLLIDFSNGTLRAKQKEYLKEIYAFDVSIGNSLPNFNTNYDTLNKYKEFIGDRLINELIFTLLSQAQKAFPDQFVELLGKPKTDYRKLAKSLLGPWKSNNPDKETIIKKILERNQFFVEGLDWPPNITAQQINDWLNSLSVNVIGKGFVQRIFNDLYDQQYAGMQKEMDKFEFKREGRGAGLPFRFVLSKRKMHSVAMYNMGVCIAPDDKVWKSKDFWQMIIFDEENNACGGVIYRTIIEDGKAYLTASIQPSGLILSSVSSEQTYARIIQFSRLIVKILGYQNLLLPTAAIIHSNRGSIQTAITSKNYPVIKLKHNYDFSYSPYHYQYQEFFIVT